MYAVLWDPRITAQGIIIIIMTKGIFASNAERKQIAREWGSRDLTFILFFISEHSNYSIIESTYVQLHICSNPAPAPSENQLLAIEVRTCQAKTKKKYTCIKKKDFLYFCNSQWFSQSSQDLGKYLTVSGLRAMDSIHCLVLYNLQTPVLSTTPLKMKLLSKYTAWKQLWRTEQLL